MWCATYWFEIDLSDLGMEVEGSSMKAGISVQLLRGMIGNPLTRKILSGMSKYCGADEKNRIEVGLELYLGLREDACSMCRISEKVLTSVLNRGGKAFGLTKEQLRQRFSDPYWRMGLVNVIRGIADFGVTKPFVPGAPFQVVWDVTYACNLKCKHCYASAGKKHEDELTNQESIELVDRLARLGISSLAFSGGEPLVRPDIIELVERASDHGMYVSMATNGTLIDKEKATELKEAGLEYLQISLDGATPASHNDFRSTPGAFERTVEGVRNAVQEGFFVNISTTLTREKVDEMPQIFDVCSELGIDWFMGYNFIPTGRGENILSLDLSPEEREAVLNQFLDRMGDVDFEILTTAPQFARVALERREGDSTIVPTHFYNQEVDDSLFNLTEFVGGCGAGRFYMAIRANGDIDPCVFFPLTVGNVRDDDLQEIWKNNEVFKELRDKDLLQDQCGSCEYRYHCGGCRARAYTYFDDYLAPDPGCIKNLEHYREVVQNSFIDIEEKAPSIEPETMVNE